MLIDMVFTYVNGKDIDYINKKYEMFNIINNTNIISFNPSIRHTNINEILYSVQSVLKFIPWINKIYIITDNQSIHNLIQNSKIIFINHTDIIPSSYLPTYNSDTIESFIHNIPNLSEIFLYNNDDVFHLDFINETDIYTTSSDCEYETNKISLHINSKFNLNIIRNKNTEYSKRICLTADILLKKYQDIVLINNHHTKILRKSTLKYIETEFSDLLHQMRSSRFRSDYYIQYLLLALNIDHYTHNNIISNDFTNIIELHLGSKTCTDNFFNQFKDRQLKFVCFNSMDQSYKTQFKAFMDLIFN